MLVMKAVPPENLQMHIGNPSMGNCFKEYDVESQVGGSERGETLQLSPGGTCDALGK